MIANLFYLLGIIAFLVSLPGTIELFFLTLGAILYRFIPYPSVPKPMQKPLKMVAVIPAHNEEKNISHTIRSLQASGFLEDVFVIADNCIDNTAEVAKQAGASVLIRSDTHLLGKPYALSFAYSSLSSKNYDVFLIIDADTVVTDNLKEELERTFQEGAGAVQVYHGLFLPDQSLQTRIIHLFFEALNYVRPVGRMFWRLSCGILGNGFAIHRDTLAKVPFMTRSDVEELEYHLLLVKAGYKVVYTDIAQVYSDISPSLLPFLSQQNRRERGKFHLLLEWGPKLFKEIYRGAFRYIEPLLNLTLLPLPYHGILILLLLFHSSSFIQSYALLALLVFIIHLLFAMSVRYRKS